MNKHCELACAALICCVPIYQLSDDLVFPPPEGAEDGVVAIGGDLSVDRLLLAYYSGIFPWFNELDPIIWWSPDPRFVLFPEKLHISKSMRRVLRNHPYQITYNQDFEGVISNCQQTYREGQEGTWITEEMRDAYIELHRLGHATSIEIWDHEKLVGGMYGIDLGHIFSGESMFSLVSNASKIALITFVQDFAERGGQLFDCQVHSEHLSSLGAEEISREEFLDYLDPLGS